jgi:hypothetical protein
LLENCARLMFETVRGGELSRSDERLPVPQLFLRIHSSLSSRKFLAHLKAIIERSLRRLHYHPTTRSTYSTHPTHPTTVYLACLSPAASSTTSVLSSASSRTRSSPLLSPPPELYDPSRGSRLRSSVRRRSSSQRRVTTSWCMPRFPECQRRTWTCTLGMTGNR